MMRASAWMLAALLLVSGCESLPEWVTGTKHEIKRTPGERIDVVFTQTQVTADSEVATVPIEIPDQANLAEWPNRNAAMETPHIGLTGIAHAQHVTVGDGVKFSRSTAPAPLVIAGKILAMDASGSVAAYDETNLDKQFWSNSDGLAAGMSDVFGGGLAVDDSTVFVTTGNGGVRSLSLADGKTKWKINVGAPVNGAPAVGHGLVVVLTADNQTIALDAATGATRWTHRGIREAASYFSTTAPSSAMTA